MDKNLPIKITEIKDNGGQMVENIPIRLRRKWGQRIDIDPPIYEEDKEPPKITKEPLKVTEIKDNGGYEHDFIGSVDGEVIGRAELLIDKTKNEAELRIHLIPEWQNKGYGLELTKVTVERGLTYLNRIWLGFEEGNERARKTYEKAGFKYTLHRMEITNV